MTFEDKHEPKTMNELVFADITARQICERYAFKKPSKPLMLWGPPGTAKTMTARVIVRERYKAAGYNGAIEEFNGADLTPADFDKLLNIANMLNFACNDAVLLINEIDELETSQQAQFRSWMDKHKWVKLIVTTNEQPGVQGVKQKLMPALQSRFERVELAPPTLTDWLPRAQQIFQAEGIEVTQSQSQNLLDTFNGDLRDALPIMEEAIDALRADLAQLSSANSEDV